MVENETFIATSSPQKSSKNFISVVFVCFIIILFGLGIYILFVNKVINFQGSTQSISTLQAPIVQNITDTTVSYTDQGYDQKYKFASSVRVFCINPGFKELDLYTENQHATFLGEFPSDQVKKYISKDQKFIPSVLIDPSGENVIISLSLFDCPSN